MITMGTRAKLLTFLVLSVVGIAFVGIRYVGLGDRVLGGAYRLKAEFVESGGVFTNASVTYRGVPVGKVGELSLRPFGVQVELLIDRGVRIPRDVTAVVANRSAVGEQYVDLRPATDAGPYLEAGDRIPKERTSGPLPVETLLVNLEKLVRSISVDDLTVVIDELGRAFAGNEQSVQRILDSLSAILTDANQYLPTTLQLLRDSQTVLETQRVSASAIRQWAHSLALLTETLRTSDPDIRRLLVNGPPAAAEVLETVRGLDTNMGVLLGNLITVGGVAVRRFESLGAILVAYPLVVAGGNTVVPGDGTAHFGFVLNFDNPPPCKYDRAQAVATCSPNDLRRGGEVRGWQRAPGPSEPEIPVPPLSGPGTTADTGRAPSQGAAPSGAYIAGFDPATGLVLAPDGMPLGFGGTGGHTRLAGAQSWKALLLAGLH